MGSATVSVKTPSLTPGSLNWRYLLVAGGMGLWIGLMALRTGFGTFIVFWNVLFFMGALVIVTIPTRTVTVMELLATFSLGGSVVGLSVLAGWFFGLAFGTHAMRARSFVIPLVEEGLKIIPVLLILWRLRKRRALTFGVTDILLLAAASGSAFYFVEEAFIIHNKHSWSLMGSFPTTDVERNFIANHGIWTAITGLTIGISLLFRKRGLGRLLVAVSGGLWSALDHASNNYNVLFQDATGKILLAVTGKGHFSMFIFLFGVCFGVALDLYLIYFVATGPPLPGFPVSWKQVKTALRYLRLSRQFAYARARYRNTAGKVHDRLAVLGLALETALRNLRLGMPVLDRKTG